MKPLAKKILKWTGAVAGSLLVVAVGLGAYVYSLLPHVPGDPPPLQGELFTKPSAPAPMPGKYVYKSATELAAMIRNHAATSVDIVREHLAHIKNENHRYAAVVWLREKEALSEAQAADAAVSRGDTLPALHGVPITIKEQFWVKGLPCTLNSRMFGGFVAPDDGPLVAQLKKAGAIVLGTTNVPFMLGDYQTQGELYPTGSNPYDTRRTPGGSTGGGAAAVAAGFTPLELGADMGGSITVPAAFCGIYALKPTFGSLNVTEGDGPDTTTKYTRLALAVAGPLARTPEDLELMWTVLRDAAPDARFQKKVSWSQPSEKTLAQYRIAWTDDWKHGDAVLDVGNDVKLKLRGLVEGLKKQGVTVAKAAPDTLDAMLRAYFVALAHVYGETQPWLMRKLIALDTRKFDDGSVDMSAFFETIGNPDEASWKKWQDDDEALVAKWRAFFADHDFFLYPVTYGPAFEKGTLGAPITAEGKTVPYMKYLFPYTAVFSATGHPAVIVPMGRNHDGLPIGVQIVGPLYSEPELLHFAKLLGPVTPGFSRPGEE